MKPDFSVLYSQLGLSPDCSLDQLKHAYRRRIAELHPDRGPAADDSAGEGQIPLSDLNSIYAAALRFHRQHGRLPGSRPALAPRTEPLPPATEPEAIPPAPLPEPAIEAAAAARRPTIGLVVVLAILALAVFLDSFSSGTDMSKDALSPDMAPTAGYSNAQDQLILGMDMATVISIQGNPVEVRGDEWAYGPSWLRFDKGELVDWHSSPLRRLKTSSESPPTQASVE